MTNIEIAIGTSLLLLGTNLIGFIYSAMALYSNLFSRYRIQSKSYEKGILGKRLPLYSLNLIILIALSGSSMLMFGQFFDTKLDSWWIIASQVLFVFLIDDIWFYFAHRWMHENKLVLKKIHSIHHRATTPFPLEYLYVHPLEWMLGMIGSAIGIGLIFIIMPMNIYAFWIFGLIRNLHEIHIHSDLHIPYLSSIPFISSTKNHDDHHAFLNGNYASTFSIWDRVLKTQFKNRNV